MNEVRQAAKEELAQKVKEFENLIAECEVICDKHELSFEVNPTYGAGAIYDGGEENEDTGDSWFASSQGC